MEYSLASRMGKKNKQHNKFWILVMKQVNIIKHEYQDKDERI